MYIIHTGVFVVALIDIDRCIRIYSGAVFVESLPTRMIRWTLASPGSIWDALRVACLYLFGDNALTGADREDSCWWRDVREHFLETKISCSTAMPSLFSKISQESKIELAASCMLQCHPTAHLWNFLGSLPKTSPSILTGTKRNCLVRGVPCESSELCQDFGWDYTFSTFHDLWPPSVTACALAHWPPVPSEMPSLGNE